MNRVRQEILAYRESNRITQSELAKRLNCSRDIVAAWETKDIIPKQDLLISIANLCGVSVDYLLGNTDIRAPILKHITKHQIGNETLTELHSTVDALDDTQAKMILALIKAYIKEDENNEK